MRPKSVILTAEVAWVPETSDIDELQAFLARVPAIVGKIGKGAAAETDQKLSP